jgi:hypothetical protein
VQGVSVAQAPQVGRQSFLFNGTNGYMQWAHHSDYEFGNRDFTIEWWEYRNAVGGCVVARDYSTTYCPFLICYGPDRHVYMTEVDGSWSIISAPVDGMLFGTAPVGVWQHLCIQRSGTTVWLFVNGVITVGKTIPAAASIRPSTANLTFGTAQNTQGGFFNGYLDEFRISNVARYGGNFTPSTVPFIP